MSVVVPIYNEAPILEGNLKIICEWLEDSRYRWEVVLVNDGSADESGAVAEAFAAKHDGLRVYHHKRNLGVGRALAHGISRTTGEYVVTLDADLTYSADHIGRLVEAIGGGGAQMVIASPFMQGGSLTAVPRLRAMLSRAANRLLGFLSGGELTGLTGMVRAYQGEFVRSMMLRATDMDFMPDVVYKSMVLRADIEQIPGNLDWSRVAESRRRSSVQIGAHIVGTILSGFMFRPFMFFVVPGVVALSIAVYANGWMLVHVAEAYDADAGESLLSAVSGAVAEAYRDFPHSFVIGMLSLTLGIQLMGLGFLAFQNKKYFEEIYYAVAGVRRESRSGAEGRSTDE